MSEKLCLKWNDFQENVNTAFGNLRGNSNFSDVTLACEDGQQFEAHKVNWLRTRSSELKAAGAKQGLRSLPKKTVTSGRSTSAQPADG